MTKGIPDPFALTILNLALMKNYEEILFFIPNEFNKNYDIFMYSKMAATSWEF